MMAVAAAQKNREMFAIKKSYSIERCLIRMIQDLDDLSSAFPFERVTEIAAEIGACEGQYNGYPSRRRSLVDDARFESLVVKQNKQTVLEEARQKSNDEATLEECIQQAKGAPLEQEIDLQADQSVEGVEIQADVHNIGEESDNETSNITLGDATQGERAPGNNNSNNSNDAGLTEEEILLANAASESPDAENVIQSAAIIVNLKEGISSLGRILKAVETFKGTVQHVESRASREAGIVHDVLIKVDMTRGNLLQLIRSLRQSGAFNSISLLAEHNISVKTPWFPKHASELDNCNHLMTKYEPDLDMNHPGFADKVYRQRRKEIAEIAFAYKYGDPIPHIEYTDVEIKTWRSVLLMVIDLSRKHACAEYRAAFQKLREEEIFVEHRLPQLQEMSDFLRRNTGFTLRPAAGLLTARDFLASLAFRIFQSTQYVRHVNSPYHTPEPDCIHELLGHMPLLADPSFAQFSQEIGLASLGASDDEIEKLSTVYWFTVEFGLCKEQGQVKAYGAGLLSAYGELLHAISDKCEHRPFEPASTAVQPYQDQEYQPIYYVAESFEDAKEKFRRWVSTMSRPFEVRFNPHTERVEILDSVDKLDTLVQQMNTEILHLTNAIAKLKRPF